MHKFKEIGERIKRFRNDMSQVAFARKLGISLPALQNYEYGKRIPPAPVLQKIAEICGLTTDWILTGTDPLADRIEDVPYWLDDELLKILEKMKGMSKDQKMEVLLFIERQKLLSEQDKKPRKGKGKMKR